MKIAAVSITYNDDYKFKEWCEWYKGYKEDLYLHIIVDNGSSKTYLNKVKAFFKESTIIERGSNGGCTISYNDGIRYALKDKNVTHIALVGNDIKLSPNALIICANALEKDKSLGMVEPVLLYKDSMLVNDFGCGVDELFFMHSDKDGVEYDDLVEDFRYCECVTGGMNVATRDFYEKVGLQDEKLFMYSDEVDMGLRAKAVGFKMAAIRGAIAWHQHINPPSNPSRRHPFSKYLIARNKTYLANKYSGRKAAKHECRYFIKDALRRICIDLVKFRWGKSGKIKEMRWQIIGAFNGLIGNMNHNKYSHL